MRPRFLFDEHLSHAIGEQLRRLQPDIEVLYIGDFGAPPKSTPDPDILIWAEQNSFLLITNDHGTMSTHLADHLATGRSCPGIICLKRDPPMSQIIDSLHTIWGASEMEEYANFISYIPI
jgi:hypothetical protein